MAPIVELWSDADQQRLDRFIAAIAANDVRSAIVALNSGDVEPIREAIARCEHTVREADDFGGLLGVASAIATTIEDTWHIALDPDHALIDECELAQCWHTQSASPRTLALLWVYTATTLGYDAHWLEMSVFHPVCIRDGASEIMVDSTSGRLVSKADCVEIFEAVVDDEPFDPDMFLQPSAREVALDVLELRLAGASAIEDEVLAYRHMRFHAELNKNDPRAVFASAIAAAKIGDHIFAERTLERLASECEDAQMRVQVQRALQRIRAQFPYMN